MTMNAQGISHRLRSGVTLLEDRVVLDLSPFRIAIRSNSLPLLQRLNGYFSHVVSTGPTDVEVIAIEAPATTLGLAFDDWKREPGKVGRKDACHDLVDGRLVHKVRTGMLLLQSADDRIAYGPCLANDNQVINFLNCQYMNWLQRSGALICHAAGIVLGESCLGIAGFSGGGKSTLMLHLLDSPGSSYLTNDRLFLRATGFGGTEALGIPKMPRVNPGTILSLPALCPMLSDAQRREFAALPLDQLWHLEQKFDVDVEGVYGPGRVTAKAPIEAVLILNWSRDADASCTLRQVSIDQRPDLLSALMKSPGPFYQHADGTYHRDNMQPDTDAYLESLRGITVWEACGKVDFEVAADLCRDLMRSKPCSRT